jgi:Na+/H+-dicarboxylate symporter
LGFCLGIAILKIPEENGKSLSLLFSSLFKMVLKVAEFITIFMPIAIFAFTVLLVIDLKVNFSHFNRRIYCYTSSVKNKRDIPLTMMGLILPFYAFLDMCETALNVWSDISVTAIVDKEVKQSLRNEFSIESIDNKCSA